MIDVLLSARRDAAAARRFFTRVLRTLKVIPSEVVTDAAPVCPAVLAELVFSAWHHVEQYANNPIHRARPSHLNGSGRGFVTPAEQITQRHPSSRHPASGR